MARKKFREITVDGQLYAWQVTSCGLYGTRYLKIWKDKKVIFDEDTVLETIQPGDVANIIKSFLS